jgi:hypothetical protein
MSLVGVGPGVGASVGSGVGVVVGEGSGVRVGSTDVGAVTWQPALIAPSGRLPVDWDSASTLVLPELVRSELGLADVVWFLSPDGRFVGRLLVGPVTGGADVGRVVVVEGAD